VRVDRVGCEPRICVGGPPRKAVPTKDNTQENREDKPEEKPPRQIRERQHQENPEDKPEEKPADKSGRKTANTKTRGKLHAYKPRVRQLTAPASEGGRYTT
jgi:hypothetical protein